MTLPMTPAILFLPTQHTHWEPAMENLPGFDVWLSREPEYEAAVECDCGCHWELSEGDALVLGGRTYHWEHGGPIAAARVELMTGNWAELMEAAAVVAEWSAKKIGQVREFAAAAAQVRAEADGEECQ